MSTGNNKNNRNSGQLMSRRETDWFRGMAVVMVVLSHYAEWWTWFTPTQGAAETFRFALTKLGVYGVDIFFLCSGYAMVKSLGNKRMNLQFVRKRIKNVYIPYFLVVGVIELLSGGFTSVPDFLSFATGYDYWYMFVLFAFYIGFMVIYAVIGSRALRVITFSTFTYAFSYLLYDRGMQDFWYVSNIAFAAGVTAGEYEGAIRKGIDKAGSFLAALLAVGMVFAVRSGLYGNAAKSGADAELLLWYQVGAAAVWTLLILVLAAKCRTGGWIFGFLGRNSLYIYLTHTFLFMWCMNNLEMNVALRFALSALATAVVSALCNLLIRSGGITAVFQARFFGQGMEKRRKK